jgi:putative transposase
LSATSFRTRADARLAVFDYIEALHNPIRRHSALAYLSPAELDWRDRSEPITAA